MGKTRKAVKAVDKREKETKVKKLLNKPGVGKAKVKSNLKETRVPLTKILENKLDVVDKSINLTENVKSVKKKKEKNVLKTVENIVEPKVETKIEQVPALMKSLKRKSSSENTVKLPIPKKKGSPSIIAGKTLTKEEAVNLPEIKEEPEVEKKNPVKTDEEIVKKDSELRPKKKEILNIDKSQVVKGVSAVLKLAKIETENKKNLFGGESQPIFLQVACIKVPKVPQRRLRMMLPNTLVTSTDDVALFVGDLKKGRAQDFEPTINYYEDLLRENGCTQIKDIIPLTQVKTEYDQYELKRKLLSSYDYFLTDGKIAGHLSHLLGKTFTNKRKLPTSVKMNSKNLKLAIDDALKKTSMQLHSFGNTYVVQIAHTSMEKQHILSSILYVSKCLAEHFPGGWNNIRSLSLKTATGLAVPIYVTLKSKNKVKVPVIIPKRPKAHRTVSGELSTTLRDTTVIVKPDGTVTTERNRRRKKINSHVNDVPEEKKIKLNKKKNEKIPADENTEDPKKNKKSETTAKRFEDSDEEIEEAEQAYLNQWQEESSSTAVAEEKKETKKKSKIVKKKKTKAYKI